jgi:hypothetical protein
MRPSASVMFKATFSQPIDWEGLNYKDKQRIAKVGFNQWWKEACDAQAIRLSKVNTRTSRTQTRV